MKVLRKEYPRVRETKKSGNRYYEVDCRKVGWTGKPKFTFSKRDDALKKAKEIGELFQRDGVSGLLENSNLLDNRRLLVLEAQLSIYGKSLEDAVHHYLEQLKSARIRNIYCVDCKSRKIKYQNTLSKQSM